MSVVITAGVLGVRGFTHGVREVRSKAHGVCIDICGVLGVLGVHSDAHGLRDNNFGVLGVRGNSHGVREDHHVLGVGGNDVLSVGSC